MNFFTYLQIQQQEDHQAFIIHYPAGSGKTFFARRACQLNSHIFLLDLLDQFQQNPALKVKGFHSDQLANYLLKFPYPAGTQAVLVDHGDFLFNTWKNDEKASLIHWLDNSLRSPAVLDKTLVFIIQTDEVLSTAKMLNSHGQPRVLQLNTFDAL